jgi:hypothetical protein
MTRFYVEENEIDVQDPKFFFEEEELIEQRDAIDEMISVYA